MDAVSKGFSIDLEVYKSYNQQQVEGDAILSNTQFDENSRLTANHDIAELEQRYIKLLAERARIEGEHQVLMERLNLLESTLLIENTELMKKLTTQNELILGLLSERRSERL